MNVLDRGRWVADTVRDHLWVLRKMAIGPRDFVLEVGSGGSPSPRANVLSDLFPDESHERHGQPLRVDRPFVVADAERLPFADRSFDYVICSHVLEHVEDPAAAIRELQRVAPRGYIETPNASWEKLQGFTFHRWLVDVRDGALRFRRKAQPQWDPTLRQWFSSVQSELGIEELVWFSRRRIGVYVSYPWEGSIDVVVEEDPGEVGERIAGAGEVGGPGRADELAAGGGVASRVIDRLGERLRGPSMRPWSEIERLLRCPSCRGELAGSLSDGYRCGGCGAAYPVDLNGRPRLVPGA